MTDTNYTEPQIAMTLAAIAYAPYGDISGYLSNPSFATNGEWYLAWGPGETNGNQMFVAKRGDYNQYAISIIGAAYSHLAPGYFAVRMTNTQTRSSRKLLTEVIWEKTPWRAFRSGTG